MPDTTTSANMGLELPNVSTAPGPQWATDVNTALTQIDQHSHAPTLGVPVPSVGININSDLPFNINNATSIRSVRFEPSTATSGTDVRALSAAGDDLFYRDGLGRRIQLTQQGGVMGASGNITGLASPAQLTYVPGTATFVFTSSATVAANIDSRNVLVRSSLPGSNAVTIAATTSTNAWTATLPSSAGGSIGRVLADADGNGILGFLPPNTSQRGSQYLGLAAATTTDTNDSIRITHSTQSALSTTRPAYVTMPATTAGQLSNFVQTTDVTLNLTGCTWGLGGVSDLTDGVLRVYALNDANTLRWGVSLRGGYRQIPAGLASTATANITSSSAMFVNSSLSSSATCMEVGWFIASFDDTGGASEDLWTVQSQVSSIGMSVPAPVNYDWRPVTPSGSKGPNNTTYSGWEKRVGDTLFCRYHLAFSGATSAGAIAFDLTGGKRIDTSKLPVPADINFRILGVGSLLDNGNQVYATRITAGSASFPASIQVYYEDDTALGIGLANITTNTAPITIGNLDSVTADFQAPILGWSGNDSD